jgi:hypothetical protein
MAFVPVDGSSQQDRRLLICTAAEVRPPGLGAQYVPRAPEKTALHSAVRSHLSTFMEATGADGAGIPKFVIEGFKRYLGCGILGHGFARYRCGDCGYNHLVPLSCKVRGLCVSCGGRRMMVLTRHVMDKVLPRVPVRQWVLSLPFPLRYRLAYDHDLCTAVHRAFMRALRMHYRRKAESMGGRAGQSGAVTFCQRSGGALNLNVHYHTLALDGSFHRNADGDLEFTASESTTQLDVEELLLDIQVRVMRVIRAAGLLEEGGEDPLAQDTPSLAACYEGAVTQRLALGPERGRPVFKLKSSLGVYLDGARERLEVSKPLCAQVDGFDLHGNMLMEADERGRLEDIVRYCARPALSHDRLEELEDGRYLLKLKSRYRDGSTHVRFDPIELLERLAAQIPRPHKNLVFYSGVLAPAAKSRAEVVKYGAPKAEVYVGPSGELLPLESLGPNYSWAELMRVTFDLDVLKCPRCSGRMRYIATITEREVVKKILEHVGLPVRGPPQEPASNPPPFWPEVEENWGA